MIFSFWQNWLIYFSLKIGLIKSSAWTESGSLLKKYLQLYVTDLPSTYELNFLLLLINIEYVWLICELMSIFFIKNNNNLRIYWNEFILKISWHIIPCFIQAVYFIWHIIFQKINNNIYLFPPFEEINYKNYTTWKLYHCNLGVIAAAKTTNKFCNQSSFV